jgi:adenine-specific DNA-methyltransferase
MTKEQKFYKALQDVFIGAKIEGEGGFVNLMRIKSNYYRNIEVVLIQDVEKTLKNYPKFRDELFDKLYSFFSRYFTESGSIYFNSTPFHNNIYEKIYTDEKDVILFWKTQMLYYVKTDRIFKSMPVEFDGFKFYFDASKMENKKANEKRSLVFELKQGNDNNTLTFDVIYSEKGKKTKYDDILKAVKKKGFAITKEQLERAFGIFEKQSEIDFFINKNAIAFLQEQFKLWSYQYFWEGAKEWNAERVNQLQILKNLAFKIIDFIAQFENELVKIWNKPKFACNARFVITMEKIDDERLIEKIKNHKNYNQQIKEWEELGIDHSSSKVPIDTRYFKDLELEILGTFKNLDESLDGWLIKSENYQALNTILPKFRSAIDCLHIDPPYNTDISGFLYANRFKRSSWLAMMYDRIKISTEMMSADGSFLCHIDENEYESIRFLVEPIFGYVGTAVWDKLNPMMGAKELALQHEYILFCAFNPRHFYIRPENVKKIFSLADSVINKHGGVTDGGVTDGAKQEFKDSIRKTEGLSGGERAYQYLEKDGRVYRLVAMTWPNPNPPPPKFFEPLIHPITKKPCPVPNRGWSLSPDNLKRLIEQNEIVFGRDETTQPQRKVYLTNEKALSSVIRNGARGKKDLEDMGLDFPYSHPVSLYETLIDAGLNGKKDSIIFDYFAGSGTTAHAVMKLNIADNGKRKFILVELNDYLHTITIPRLKKASYSLNWKNGKPQDSNGSGVFLKYYELEQYEETLANCKYEDGDLFNLPSQTPYQEYVFMKDEKMLKALEIDFNKESVTVNLDNLYPNIDIAETLSNLTGKWIKKIRANEVEFTDGSKLDIKDLDYKLIKPLIWW